MKPIERYIESLMSTIEAATLENYCGRRMTHTEIHGQYKCYFWEFGDSLIDALNPLRDLIPFLKLKKEYACIKLQASDNEVMVKFPMSFGAYDKNENDVDIFLPEMN